MFVLLVEDERDQRELVADILEANAHRVVQADSVESAILELKKMEQIPLLFIYARTEDISKMKT